MLPDAKAIESVLKGAEQIIFEHQTKGPLLFFLSLKSNRKVWALILNNRVYVLQCPHCETDMIRLKCHKCKSTTPAWKQARCKLRGDKTQQPINLSTDTFYKHFMPAATEIPLNNLMPMANIDIIDTLIALQQKEKSKTE